MKKSLKTFFLIVAAVVFLADLGSCRKENYPTDNQSSSVVIKKATSHGSSDKIGIPDSIPIVDNKLSINFTEAIGIVDVSISTKKGKLVQRFLISTPCSVETFVIESGTYNITFTLDDGSEYGGNFAIR